MLLVHKAFLKKWRKNEKTKQQHKKCPKALKADGTEVQQRFSMKYSTKSGCEVPTPGGAPVASVLLIKALEHSSIVASFPCINLFFPSARALLRKSHHCRQHSRAEHK